MRIAWELSIYGGTIRCLFCGEWTTAPKVQGQRFLLAVVYGDQGKVYGEACHPCVHQGPKVLRTQLHERLQQLQVQLEEVTRLTQEEIITPRLEAEFHTYR